MNQSALLEFASSVCLVEPLAFPELVFSGAVVAAVAPALAPELRAGGRFKQRSVSSTSVAAPVSRRPFSSFSSSRYCRRLRLRERFLRLA